MPVGCVPCGLFALECLARLCSLRQYGIGALLSSHVVSATCCCQMIDQHELLASSSSLPSPLAKFPLLIKFYAAFKALPTLAGYFAGPLNQLPPNNKMAAWGAKPDGGTS